MARDILSAIKHAKTSALQFSELISIMHRKNFMIEENMQQRRN